MRGVRTNLAYVATHAGKLSSCIINKYEGGAMTLKQFIKEHREELDQCIARALGRSENPRANDEERRLWILNDEGLYRWAMGEGVRI